MKAIKFDQSNAVYAANQPEYLPLPAHVAMNGYTTICFELTDEDLERIKETKRVYLSVRTFKLPLQPLKMATDIDDVISLQECESCGNSTDMETMTTDDDCNWFCETCWEELSPVMKAEYDALVKSGDIEPNDD